MNFAPFVVAAMVWAQPEAPPICRAAFLPSTGGFAFTNHFEGSSLPKALREGDTPLARVLRESLDNGKLPAEFGLCGGMSLAAADYFHAGRLPPAATKPPRMDTPLYDYLYQRQTDSLGAGAIMALKFLQWMNLPDAAATGDTVLTLTAAELPGIVQRLHAGQLVPIGLVYVRARERPVGKLWENHQVLAYAVLEKDGGVTDLRVYDPNFPRNDDVVIRCTPVKAPGRPQVSAVRVIGKGQRPIRGFFAMPYEKKTPPEIK